MSINLTGEPWDEVEPSQQDDNDRPSLRRGASAPPVSSSSAFNSNPVGIRSGSTTSISARTTPRGSPTLYSTNLSDPPRGSPTSYKSSLNDRWSKYELDDDILRAEADAASFKAITMAAERAFQEKVTGVNDNSSARSKPRASPTNEMPGSATKKWTDRLSRYTIGTLEDEEEDIMEASVRSNGELLGKDTDTIRAEAMEMLKKADGKLKAPYAVQRSETGGYNSSLESPLSARRSVSEGVATRNKRVPAALSGLNLHVPLASPPKITSPPQSQSQSPSPPSVELSDNAMSPDTATGSVRTRSALEISRQYDNTPTPSIISSNTRDTLQENFDELLKEEEDLINVAKPSNPGSKWSSRYSIDQTLKALTGGGKSPKEVLDEIDRENMAMTESERQITGVVRDLFWGSAHQEDEPGADRPGSDEGRIFGAGFSFRQKHVFGKQNVDADRSQGSSDTNLHTVWMDLDQSKSSLPPPEPRKTWQEQMQRRKNQQRQYAMYAVAALLCIVTIIASVTGTRRRVSSSNGALYVGDAVTFYVTSNTPFDTAQEDKLTDDLSALTSLNGEFLIHLGNIQDSDVTLCASSRYPAVRDILLDSPVPVLLTPGEEDWNNCPNPEHAWRLWVNNFGLFESNFQHDFRINRQQRRPENFGFVHKNVLFIGFHLVGGRIDDIEQWNTRHEDNIAWMESMVTITHDQFRAIVMFGNARPGPQQRQFFTRLQTYLGTDSSIPVIYIHANTGVGGVLQYQMFDGSDNVQALQIEDGGRNPPLRVSVGHGENPFVIG